MKIAIFTDLYLEIPGGIPSSIRAQKNGLEKLGHQVTIFCPGWEEEPGVFLVPTYKRLKIEGAPVAKLPKLIRSKILAKFPSFEFDLVHVHYEGSCSIAGVWLAREFGLPLVQTMHGREDVAIDLNIKKGLKSLSAGGLDLLHSLALGETKKIMKDEEFASTLAKAKMWQLMVRQANMADRVITPTLHFARKLKKYGVKPEVVAISNGVEERLVLGREWWVRKMESGESLKLIWNSRLSKEKRILPFLEALSLVEGDFDLMVFGVGNQKKLAEAFVKKKGLSSRVKFYGRVERERLMEAMAGRHLSVTVSDGFDTQGMTLLEAEATGLPVFYCDKDMDEVVPEGGGVRSGVEVKSMAKALEGLILNPEQIEKMSRVMLKRRNEVMQAVQTEKLVQLYQQLLEEKSGGGGC